MCSKNRLNRQNNSFTQLSPMWYGISFGNTYSALACADECGEVTIINNPDGSQLTASAVYFEDGCYCVGDIVKEAAILDPDNFVSLIKRKLGSKWRRNFFGIDHTPETISAIILKYMVKGAEKEGHSVKDVVITCPTRFNEAERAAIKAAGEIAGLNVHGLLDEPFAAVIGYGLDKLPEGAADRNILVYRLGGTSFGASIVRVTPVGLSLVHHIEQTDLGGEDWNNALRDILLDKLNSEHPEAGDPMSDPDTAADLLLTVEKTKKSLSQRETAKATIICPDAKVKVSVTRAEFEEATLFLLLHTIGITDKIIEKARSIAKENGDSEKIDEFLLVGGATCMPQIMAMVESQYKDSLGVVPKLYEPNLVEAKGAAIYAERCAIIRPITIDPVRPVRPVRPEPPEPREPEQPVAGGWMPITPPEPEYRLAHRIRVNLESCFSYELAADTLLPHYCTMNYSRGKWPGCVDLSIRQIEQKPFSSNEVIGARINCPVDWQGLSIHIRTDGKFTISFTQKDNAEFAALTTQVDVHVYKN